GVAATDAVIKLLSPGDEVMAANDMYGGTYRLFSKLFEKFGILFTYIDTTDIQAVQTAVSSKTKLIWIETP
ncbi:PLP-dependent transferase, partial [Escherichia coli]|uniref:PLP-dependent transferase n=1 Tax=Escherichia coli TaxID=562 RepID=UPI001655D40C